jgi:hypothetical protein
MPGVDADLEGRLRRLPGVLAVDPAPGLLERVVRKGRRRRRLRQASAAAAVVALLAGVLVTRTVLLDRGAVQPLGPGPARDATAARLARGHARPLPANAAAGRTGAVVAWAGGELVVWGGWTRDRLVRADGAAYDPRSGRWRPLPPAPQAQAFTVTDDRATVWTGRELLLWGGDTPAAGARADGAMRPGDGLAYDPAAGSWRRLRPPPGLPPGRTRPAGWTGQELLVVDAAAAEQQATRGRLRGAAYDPLTDRWRQLAPSPPLGSGELLERTVLWAGTRLLVWSFLDQPGSAATAAGEPDEVDLWAYDPAADRWTALASPSPRTRPLLARASLEWTGREILAVQHTSVLPPDPAPFAGRYDPDRDRWTPIADPPQRVEFGDPAALVWTGAALVAGGRHAYDPASDRWWPLPAPGHWSWAGPGPPVRRLGGGWLALLAPAAR